MHSQAGIFVTAIRGQPIHGDVFHRPAGKVDQRNFIGSTLQKLDPRLHGRDLGIQLPLVFCAEPLTPNVFLQRVPVTLINIGRNKLISSGI